MSDPIHQTEDPAHRTLASLSQTDSDTAWVFWLSMFAALIWWGGGVAGVLALYGWETVSAADPMLLAAGGAAILLPGLLILMAGIMAREHRRSARANALILEASARLLAPMEGSAGEARDFAEQMKVACAQIDRAMGHALASMKGMASEIGDERQRLESVTYASADNARELGDRLYQERAALEQLASDLQEQSDRLNESIPRQASLMLESAQAAADQVSKTETALQSRLKVLRDTAEAMTQKIQALDTLSAEAAQRNETLLFAIARVEEKLDQSRKTVETASRAGELAAAAAGTTGDRLLEAVKAALDGARQASNEIQKQTLEASEAAARIMSELRDAGEQTTSALRAAGSAARVEIDRTNRLAGRPAVTPAAPPPGRTVAYEPVADPVASQPEAETPPPPAHDDGGETDASVPDFVEDPDALLEPEHEPAVARAPDPPAPIAAAPAPAPRTEARSGPVASPSQTVEEDLFETNADRMAAILSEDDPFGLYDDEDETPSARAEPARTNGQGNGQANGNGRYHAPAQAAAAGADSREDTNSLSDIIADMEREDHTHLTREETAEHLVYRLEESGITLGQIFRPKDKKKVAQAARKGEKQRRSAINSSAGRQVDRVRKRLRNDSELMMLARDFLSHETEDALNALENTHGTQKNASARLATFLLIDAALA